MNVVTSIFGVLTDTATQLALATVLIVDVYTAYRAHEKEISAKLLRSQRTTVSTPTERFLATHGHSLEGPWLWGLPLIAALTLITMFFLLPYLGSLLIMFSSAACCIAIIFVLLPLGSIVTRRIGLLREEDNVSAAIVSPIAITIVGYWLFTGSYLANNVLGVALCIMFGALCRVQSFRSLVVLMCGLFAYDVFFVFFSDKFFSKNVMVEVATNSSTNPVNTIASWLHLPVAPVKDLSMPAKLIFPSPDGSYLILGLGDIVLPLLLLIYLVKLDLTLDFPLWKGFFAHALIAHIAALFVSFYCNAVFQAAQPALFYIVPLTLGVTTFLANRNHVLTAMWNDTISSLPRYRQLQNASPEELEAVIGAKNDDEVSPV